MTSPAPRGPDPAAAAPPRIRRAAAAIAVLLAVAGSAALTARWLWGDRPGADRAVAIACIACLPGLILGRCLTGFPSRDPGRAFAAGLAAIALRTLLPLAGLAWLTSRPPPRPGADGGPPPADAAATLVGFYLALLATDVILHIMAGSGGGRRGH